MRTRVDSRYLLAVGTLILWGCPIDDAFFKEPVSGSTSGSSSTSGGGAGGNAGAAGMGGVMASSSSSGGGMGGGPVCPGPGTVDSCGKPGCPDCPTLVMVGTGMTNGTAATFESGKGWSTSTISGMKSDYPPAFAIRPGKGNGVAVFRNTTAVSLNRLGYSTWNVGGGFGAVNDVDGNNALVDFSPVVAASPDMVHVGFLETGNGHKYHYAAFNGAMFNPTNDLVKDASTTSLGHCAPGLTIFGTNVVLINPGETTGDESLYGRNRMLGPLGVWDSGFKFTTIALAVDDVTPAIAALNAGPELLVVFTEKISGKPLHYLTRSGGTWGMTKPIPSTSSIEIAVMALPGGGAILVYRHFTTNAIFVSRFDGTNWSAVVEIPGSLTAKSKPALALGAGDAEAELLFVDATGNAQHARLRKGEMNFDSPTAINGATGLVGIAAATNL